MSYQKKPDVATLSDVQYLETLPTRELLSMHRNAQTYGDYSINAQGRNNAYKTFQVRAEDIKLVLAKRPHVPNKNENRGLIKQRKAQGSGR